MQHVKLNSAIAPKASTSKQILFPTVLNRKELDDISSLSANEVVEIDLRSSNKLQSTISGPYLSAFASSPLVLDLPFSSNPSLPESDLRKLQIYNQLIADPMVVAKVMGASEAEPYQLSALRDEDRSFFYSTREGFQDLHDYVDSSIEVLEPKASNDAAAVALSSFMRQAPAYLAIDWLETPKQRMANHDTVDIYVNASVMSTANFLLTEMGHRRGIPSENLDYLKSPVLQNAAMKATANASSSGKSPIFSPEALDRLIEWCCEPNPAKAALAEFDKSKVKDKDKARPARSSPPSLTELTKTLQLVLKFIGASSDITLHARNGYLSSADNIRLSPLIYSRGSRIGFAAEWYHAIRTASFDRSDRRDDPRPSRQNDRHHTRPRSRDRTEKKQ